MRKDLVIRPRPASPDAAFSLGRVDAMLRRYLYLLRSSWPRIFDLIYWPLVQMLTWGFLQTYLVHVSKSGAFSGGLGLAAGTLIGAMLLWDILFRGQLGFSVSFLEEMWARNIANLLMSPLRPPELIVALMAMSLVRLAVGFVPVTLLAIWFFGFNLWGLGVALGFFFANLILTSWSIGLVCSGLVLRYGLAAESLIWTIVFLMQPLACVFYPLAVLPRPLQLLASILPPTYVFEGLRALLTRHEFRLDLMGVAFALNVVFFGAAFAGFMLLLRSARRAGTLLQTGE
ncbi:MAG: ABC transporter permease [Beijerinckiaceae bacterium]|nr:MAG: ABC transporter permease [Beijerinckiaceae bacterium]